MKILNFLRRKGRPERNSDNDPGSGEERISENGRVNEKGATERKAKDKSAWEKSEDNGKRIDTFRKEFMGNVYHELKTPVFNLQGYILTLLDGGLEDPSINRLYLERSAKNINRMISIVEDLETISRLETETIALKSERFDLRRMVEEVLDSSEVRAAGKRIKLTIATPGSGEMMVRADRKRIYQVINNLVINSINYGTEGGYTKVWMTLGPKKMLVEVEDNGIGIVEADQQRIFERFYRVDKSRSRDSGGTGLGLAIVKHIVEAHGHTVKVKSTPGRGTTFSFTLDR
jgi:two-component system phosphate regulon sensor histidine kinase PhoR